MSETFHYKPIAVRAFRWTPEADFGDFADFAFDETNRGRWGGALHGGGSVSVIAYDGSKAQVTARIGEWIVRDDAREGFPFMRYSDEDFRAHFAPTV